MEKIKAFLKRKNIEISLKRYGIDGTGPFLFPVDRYHH